MSSAKSPETTVGHYRILDRLGAGGMGVVYEAEDTNLGRRVALKFLPPELTRDVEAHARFVREARAASQLDHPNICTIHDIGETEDGQTYIAMSYYDGETLRARIERGPLHGAEALDIAMQITHGLAKAHASGVIHRDIKPANVIVTRDGIVKILDFGVAKLLGATAITRQDRIVGTPSYMAPEQLRGEDVGPQADLWSLGAVLYEMLSGRRAFSGDSNEALMYSILNDRPAVLRASGDSAALEPIVQKLLQKKASNRYQTANEVLADLEAIRAPSSYSGETVRRPARVASRPRIIGLVALIVIAVVASVVAYVVAAKRASRMDWVSRTAIPQLEALLENGSNEGEGRAYWDAYLLARRIDEILPSNPTVARLRPRFTRKLTIRSTPPGADVSVRYYGDPQGAVVHLGKTPLEAIDFAQGVFRLRVESPGMAAAEDLLANRWGRDSPLTYVLQKTGSLPADMRWIPAGVNFDGVNERPIPAFLMDRREVTNREFKRFIDAGGYRDQRWWREPFVVDGRTLGWAEAMSRFVDQTGFPGPAGWETGRYPEGSDDLPVGGVSWYEAAAYAAWSGKNLPTAFHWDEVAGTQVAAHIIPMSNFNGKGPRVAGRIEGMNRFGVVDLAGNVREWSRTAPAAAAASERFLFGGSYKDPDYMFSGVESLPPFDRDLTNGFRCIRYLDRASHAVLEAPFPITVRDVSNEKPVSDATFAIYCRQFVYDATPLDAKVEEEKPLGYATRYKITFRAAYDGPRMVLYLFLPANGKAPYQTVIIFPGSSAAVANSIDESNMLARFQFFVQSGRAVAFPVYRYTFDRRGSNTIRTSQTATALYRDNLVMWAKDLSRSIDYLETRRDIDSNKLAYFGYSWGACLGALLPAVEKRIKVNILIQGGFHLMPALPEADQVNYVTHVTQPTLMLNGRYDNRLPVDTSQRPMYEMLGTRSADKKWLTYPGGHGAVPKTELVRESNAWLDRYLGPVLVN